MLKTAYVTDECANVRHT